MSLRRLGWLTVLALPAVALGQDRDESSMFGGPEAPAVDGGAGARPAEEAMFGAVESDGGVPSRDNEQLTGKAIQNQFDTGDQKSDWLKVGGTLYQRAFANWTQDPTTGADGNTFGAPSLLDVYLDARPNDRLRGFALGRLRYDATVPSSGAPSLLPTVGGTGGSNPSVALDQLWLRFDVLRKVYLTVGRQKVKWGTGRIWNPTDFLNNQRKDPLAPFDLRLGVNAVKVHVPIESLGWNFYAFGLLDNGPVDTTKPFTLGNLGGALRAEILVGPAEVGMAGVWVNGRRPRYAADVSTPIGPFDVYGEVAFRSGKDFTVFERTGKDPATSPPEELFTSHTLDGIQVQATAGVAYSINYTESNTLTVGAEYFYNPGGATSPVFYLPQIYTGNFTPFYAGQHYLGIFALTPGLPNYPWITLNFANLLNLSDPSGVARLDAFFRVLSFLQVEGFASVNYGVKGGEFHFGGTFPTVNLPTGGTLNGFSISYPVASAGVGLRLSI